ncbi:MAG: type II toxin-antitoxin system HicA family toxin [Deltaproteobacteria bacterium]|nr:type II toxin-antitoxin system HicA family toxin [Deltaproteobacteria bacterium]
MKIPRDLSGEELVRLLEKFGYQVTRQTGSHMRLSKLGETEHHLTIPQHKQLKIGTLNNILTDLASAWGISKSELMARLWEKEGG